MKTTASRLRRTLLSCAIVAVAVAAASAQPAAAANPTVTLSADRTTAQPGDLVTFTVDVVDPTGVRGSVRFYRDNVQFASTDLSGSANGEAVARYTWPLGAGTATFTAKYAPTGIPRWTSNPVTIAVGAPQLHLTAVALAVPPIVAGQNATLTATVTRTDGTDGTPGGTVSFFDAGQQIGSAVPLQGGSASAVASGLAAGTTHSFTAAYSGDDANAASTTLAPTVVEIPAAPSVATTISAGARPELVAAGSTTTLTAHVDQTETGLAPPAGADVTFWNTSTNPRAWIGTTKLDANGDASLAGVSLPIGSWTLLATYVGDSQNTSSSASFAVRFAAAATVKAPSPAIVYGDPLPDLQPTYAGLAAGAAAPQTPAVCSTGATAASVPGSYAVTCSGAADPNYVFSYVAGTLTVAKATLTVTPVDATMFQGSNPPSLGATLSGFVRGEDATTGGVTGAAACTTTATAASPPGDYPIDCRVGTLASDRYTFAFPTRGTLTVEPRVPVTVVAPSPSIVYGDPIPALTPTYDGLPAGETLATPATCTTDADGAGTYAVTCAGAADPRYAISYENGTLTIAKATLTVTPDDATMTEGDPLPALGATISGFVRGETLATSDVSGAPACTTEATATSLPGSYAITCGAGTLAAANYDFAFPTAGTLTVKPRITVRVVAPEPSIVYGDDLPATLTPTYENLPAGETLATPATCTTAATGASGAGTYSVTCSGAADPRYLIAYVPGTLTIAKAVLDVTPQDASTTYGTIPAPTATITGFVKGETLATSGVAGAPACTTTATATSLPGTYPITCETGTLAAADYSFDFEHTGTLTIAKAPTTIAASASGTALAGSPTPLSATVLSGGRPVAGVHVTLSLGGDSCDAVTNASGVAACTVVPRGPLGPGSTTASFTGDQRYLASSAASGVLLYAFPAGGGAFVVGDLSASGDVVFWGAGWSRDNRLSGRASSSFKGFAAHAGGAGGTWTTGPGNSAKPPKGPLPAYMGVIVTSDADKSGPSISGTVTRIVVVRVDPGYDANPGHSGTGTVVG